MHQLFQHSHFKDYKGENNLFLHRIKLFTLPGAQQTKWQSHYKVIHKLLTSFHWRLLQKPEMTSCGR